MSNLRHCPHCGVKRPFERVEVIGLKWGCLLTLLTGGLFLFFWTFVGCVPCVGKCCACGYRKRLWW